MIKILFVFGTRPEVIKIAPVIRELIKYNNKFICRICTTAQHRQMLDPLLKLFDIKPDYDLNIMHRNQSLEYIMVSVLTQMKRIIKREKPDYLLIQGDTTTSMTASLAAFYRKIRIAHIEAGLRTYNKFHPFPEEINRRIIDSISDLFFVHTEEAKKNLINEGIEEEKIEITGNTVIDALVDIVNRSHVFSNPILKKMSLNSKKIILVTAHRRENFGRPLMNICEALKKIAIRFSSKISIIYPVHLNPNVRKLVYSTLNNIENVYLIPPLEYLDFIHLMKKAYLILTDSGGIQEEAPTLGKPVLVLRETTERIEGVKAGTVEVVGTHIDNIITKTTELLEDKEKYKRMSKAINPYGDGKASKRIVARLLREIGDVR